MTKTDKAKRDLSRVMMYKPSNNNKKKKQDLFEMMLMQSMMQNCEEDCHSKETQMQLYRLDMKHMDQERRQREEKIEKCEHDRECCHQKLMMLLIASIT
eukprot:1933430-Ditylum_brightwellii.AAC.1